MTDIFFSYAEKQHVYTDSMFCCGPGLVRNMVDFARECDDLYQNETCIYGDFLACMGTRPVEEKLYFQEVMSSSVVKRSIAIRFHSTPINILVLEQSRFHHLGTMPECKSCLKVCTWENFVYDNLIQSC